MRAKAAKVRGTAFGVRQHQNAREPLYALKREGLLLPEFSAAALATSQHLGVAVLGLCKTPFGARDLVHQIVACASDFLVGAEQHLGQ